MYALATYLFLFLSYVYTEEYEFAVRRRVKGDRFEEQGESSCKGAIQNRSDCICRGGTFLYSFTNSKTVYGCSNLKKFQNIDQYALFKQKKIAFVPFKKGSWTLQKAIASRDNVNEALTRKVCDVLLIKRVDYMDYYSYKTYTKHHFFIRTSRNNNFRVFINKTAPRRKYEGALVSLFLECHNSKKISRGKLLLKFAGERIYKGDFLPFPLVTTTLSSSSANTTQKLTTTTITTYFKPTPVTSKSSKDNIPLTIGIAVGVIGVLLIILALVIFICITRKNRAIAKKESRSRRASAPPAYPGLDLPPGYENPITSPPYKSSHESFILSGIPRRRSHTPLPMPPTGDFAVSLPTGSYDGNNYLMSEDGKNDIDETYEQPNEAFYLKLLDAEDKEKIPYTTDEEDDNDSPTTTSKLYEIEEDKADSGPLSPLYKLLEISTDGGDKQIKQEARPSPYTLCEVKSNAPEGGDLKVDSTEEVVDNNEVDI